MDNQLAMQTKTLFDPINQAVHVGGRYIQLTPKAFAVLDYLHSRSGLLVSKDELLAAVWPQVYVTDGVLKAAVRDLRKALGDAPREPRFIETVHRRGYRFIGKLVLMNHFTSLTA
jgi:DNA-binding winged helix-turn-helix (wHTH) protein